MKSKPPATFLLLVFLSLPVLGGCSRTVAAINDHEDRILAKRVNPEAVPKDEKTLLLELPGAMLDDTFEIIGSAPGFIVDGFVRGLPATVSGLSGSGF